MNFLIWLQAVGGLLILLIVAFFLGSLALDSLREYQWALNNRKRKAINAEIASELMDLSTWVYGDSREACVILQIVGERLKDIGSLGSNSICSEFRRRQEVDKP